VKVKAAKAAPKKVEAKAGEEKKAKAVKRPAEGAVKDGKSKEAKVAKRPVKKMKLVVKSAKGAAVKGSPSEKPLGKGVKRAAKTIAKTPAKIARKDSPEEAKTEGEGEKKLPKVPETILKRRKSAAVMKALRIKRMLINTKRRRAKRMDIFNRAEKYIMEYRKIERDEIRLGRVARNKNNFYVPAEPKLAFVMRIRGINGVSPKVRKVLQLFRLRQINNGVFVKRNKAIDHMLRIAEPYIAWGNPSLKSVHDLVYKRGFGKIDQRRIPLTENVLVEKRLGKLGIICLEDLIHEIYTVGPNFKKVTNFLWPFKLNNPTGGWRRKTNHYVEGGDFGNREEKINVLLRKMI